MVYICKPKKVQIYVNSKKKTIAQIKAETGCDVIINGGLYNMSKFTPNCHLKVDGKVLAKDQYKYYGYGWDKEEVPQLVLDYTNLDNYICCSCMVRDGKAEKMYYDSAVGRSCARTAIGTFADGWLWIYADKTNKTPVQLQSIALKAGVKDAIMLDGGGSTQCIFPTGKVTSSRKVHNYILVYLDKNTSDSATTIAHTLSTNSNVKTVRSKNSCINGITNIVKQLQTESRFNEKNIRNANTMVKLLI